LVESLLKLYRMTQVYKEGLRGEAGAVLPQAGESSGSELALIVHAATMLSLVIPTYNEQENIESLLIRTYQVLEETGLLFEIIIVDDDSPDGTWKVAQALSRAYPGVRVIRRIAERSLARAVVRGWEEARGELLAVMDGDLQHPPETLAALIKALDGADIAVASRHMEGGGVSQWSMIRRGISWGATLVATWILPGTLARVQDPMSGYFALRRAVIENVQLKPEGYKILLEVLGRGRYERVEEVPYTFIERKHGGSKLGARQCLEFLTHMTRLSWETGELKRFIKFCSVGGTGALMNMGTLAVLVAVRMKYLPAGVVAVEAAIGTNFLLNEFWVFSHLSRQSQGLGAWLKRFLKFNFFCAGGAIINLLVLWSLTEYAGIPYLASNALGIGTTALWNYGLNANPPWGSTRVERE
jgi:dolichol-phosphate mannosyltransferase